MDEMKIGSKLMTKLIGKLINRSIKKKYGYDVDVKLNDLHATIIDGTAHVHLDVDANLPKKDLESILLKAGL